MSVSVRPVHPEADADLLHRWVTAEGAEFWGMAELSRAQVAEVYGFIAEQAHLAAYLLVLGDVPPGHPVGLLQTYDPEVDEIGDWYDRRPGDVGVHLLLADDRARRGRTAEVVAAGLRFVATRPGSERLVFEPDARNQRSLALLDRLGAQRGPLVDLRTSISQKPAQFCFLSAEAALASAARLHAALPD
ncbi:GNAT family N-acetyltransferase [Nocardioides sp. SYSU DS0651]|uniref:GNAT family N-acetyltransferase n=1 Tax=Nocardioides sp. SYSU DS0651 TaxID=3415955 RepID=UPI003F4B3099